MAEIRSERVARLATNVPDVMIRVDIDHSPRRGFYVSIAKMTIEKGFEIYMPFSDLESMVLEPAKRFSKKTMAVWAACLKVILEGGTPVVDKPEMIGKLETAKKVLENFLKVRGLTIKATPPLAETLEAVNDEPNASLAS